MSSTKSSTTTTKKETTTMKSRTRHGSASRPSSKGANSKIIDDITKEVNNLTEQVQGLEAENSELKDKLRTLSIHLIESGSENGDEVDFDPNSDVLEVPTVELLSVIAGFNTRNAHKSTATESKDLNENRLEDLETRVTQLNTELAKLFKLKLKVENGLDDIDRCKNFEEVRRKAKYLLYESRATQLFVNPSTDTPPSSSPPPATENAPHLHQKKSTSHNGFPPAVRLNLERVHIATPPGKLPADTHISDMHKALQQVIIQELSLCRGNGTDWRMFAERVGIPSQLITQWKTMKLPQPMKNVLYVWGESPGATVRMLHRHLSSPQMKYVVLAKRISDFYEVD